VTTLNEKFAAEISSIILKNLEIVDDDSDEEMSDETQTGKIWSSTDQLTTVLYEKTLFFFSALFESKV